MRLLLECDVIERIQQMWRCHLSAQLLLPHTDTDSDTDSDSDLMTMLHASINVRLHAKRPCLGRAVSVSLVVSC